MNKSIRLALVAGLTGLAMASLAPAGFAEENTDAVRAMCTQQAEEDGYEGEDKANAIKACMEEQAGGGAAQQ